LNSAVSCSGSLIAAQSRSTSSGTITHATANSAPAATNATPRARFSSGRPATSDSAISASYPVS